MYSFLTFWIGVVFKYSIQDETEIKRMKLKQKDNNNESTKVIPALGESAIVRGVGDNLGETVTRQLRIVTCCDLAWRAYMRGKSVLVSLYPHLPP